MNDHITERLAALRRIMARTGLAGYIVPSSDPHQSEIVAEHWQARRWISGFTGSAGTMAVTATLAGLWTDGRYAIQAREELAGSGIALFIAGEPGVPTFAEWLLDAVPAGAAVGFDARVLSVRAVRECRGVLDRRGISLRGGDDLVGLVWAGRPQLPGGPLFVHAPEFAGRTVTDKLSAVRDVLRERGATCYLLSSLDDIAWLFNVRGSDVPFSPLALAHAMVTLDRACLFVDATKVTKAVRDHLTAAGIDLAGYDAVSEAVQGLAGNQSVFVDPDRIGQGLFQGLPGGCRTVEGKEVTAQLKAAKCEGERDGMRRAGIRDGVAMARFLAWLEKAVGSEPVTERSAAERLTALRAEQNHFVGPSFGTIAAYRDHGAMMHYQATEFSDYALEPEGVFLIDSGGQYLDGTTDITRTVVLGPLSDAQRKAFTLTLKGHIALARARFLHGATGAHLDVLARQPLWEHGIDYKCGTGHGVGHFLCVHEGPHSVRNDHNPTRLEPGMVLTVEPGVYREGEYGIRLENVYMVAEAEPSPCGRFLCFEPLSWCPFDRRGIDVAMLDEAERKWLDGYHRRVLEVLTPHLEPPLVRWLKAVTAPIA